MAKIKAIKYLGWKFLRFHTMHKKRRSDEGKADLWHNRRQNCMINGR